MGSKGKVYVHDGSATPDLPGMTLAQATSIYSRIVNYYTDTTDRDASLAAMTSTEKFGTLFWLGPVKGYFYWDGGALVPLAVYRPVVATRAASAQVATTTPLNILQNSLVLPPGNRNVEVKARCNITAGGTGGWNARAYVTGTNLAFGMIGDRALTAAGDVDAMFSSWDLVCSGTVAYTVFGINAAGTGVCDFTDTWLTIIDHGPA